MQYQRGWVDAYIAPMKEYFGKKMSNGQGDDSVKIPPPDTCYRRSVACACPKGCCEIFGLADRTEFPPYARR